MAGTASGSHCRPRSARYWRDVRRVMFRFRDHGSFVDHIARPAEILLNMDTLLM